MEKKEDITEYIIYKVENHLGEIYIGCTKATLNSRKSHHEHMAANNPTSKLHHSIAKHGKEFFNWLIIDTAESKTEAETKEKVYIDHYLSFYSLNSNRGGQGLSGRRHSEQSKQLMREKKLGVPKSDQHKQAMSISAKKRKVHGRAKLTPSKVRDIRRLLSETKLSQKEIASFFNVSAHTISSIKHKRTWRHIA